MKRKPTIKSFPTATTLLNAVLGVNDEGAIVVILTNPANNRCVSAPLDATQAERFCRLLRVPMPDGSFRVPSK